MAREARKISKSGNYYVVLRGEELFITKADKDMFLEILEKNFATGVIHGYEFTKTEIRLVVKAGEKGISMSMKPVTTSYARYFNRIHNREGKLFGGRFLSEPLETQEEIEESIKNLKSGKKTDRKKTYVKKEIKKTAVKENKADKTEQKSEPSKKEAARKNLPSWLL